MQNQQLHVQAAIQILKPPQEVFEAIVDPGKMSNYFISNSTGRMVAGQELTWNFPEFDVDVRVKVKSVEKNRCISYTWDEESGGETLVEIKLEPRGEQATLVSITEKEMPANEAGIKWLKQNTEGWANFLACLKAFLEHGINLRKAAFDFMNE